MRKKKEEKEICSGLGLYGAFGPCDLEEFFFIRVPNPFISIVS